MKNDLIKNIEKVFAEFPEVFFCSVYGSYAKGSPGISSDVDIAFASESMNPEKFLKLKKQLAINLGKEIDLIDLNRCSGLILKEILCSGLIVLNRKPAFYAELIKKMIYNQSDMMPYYNRILHERRKVFLNG